MLTSSDLLTNSVMFGKCKSQNFTSCTLHKAVPKNRSNCPVKIIFLDNAFAINIYIILGYTKDRDSCGFRVTNNIAAVQNASRDKVLHTLSSFHVGKAVTNPQEEYMLSDPRIPSSSTSIGTWAPM